MINQKSIHANFSVDSLEKAKEFYIDKLGLKLNKEHEGAIVLEGKSGAKVNIYYKENHVAWDSTVFGIEVDNVKDAVDELMAVGIYVEKLPGTDSSGVAHDPDMGDAAWLKDPAGNWICVNDGV